MSYKHTDSQMACFSCEVKCCNITVRKLSIYKVGSFIPGLYATLSGRPCVSALQATARLSATVQRVNSCMVSP